MTLDLWWPLRQCQCGLAGNYRPEMRFAVVLVHARQLKEVKRQIYTWVRLEESKIKKTSKKYIFHCKIIWAVIPTSETLFRLCFGRMEIRGGFGPQFLRGPSLFTLARGHHQGLLPDTKEGTFTEAWAWCGAKPQPPTGRNLSLDNCVWMESVSSGRIIPLTPPVLHH